MKRDLPPQKTNLKPGNPGTPRKGYNKGKIEDKFIDRIDYERSKKDPRYYDIEFLKRFIFSQAASDDFHKDQSAVFLLRYELKKSGKETAKIMGVSQSMVSKNLRKAIFNIEKRLARKLNIYLKGSRL